MLVTVLQKGQMQSLRLKVLASSQAQTYQAEIAARMECLGDCFIPGGQGRHPREVTFKVGLINIMQSERQEGDGQVKPEEGAFQVDRPASTRASVSKPRRGRSCLQHNLTCHL